MPVSQCNGANLYYEEEGAGRPIVFLHGAWAGLRFFEPQLMNLSDEFQTVALDFRGHGRSEKSEAGHTVPQYARDVRAFLDHQDLDEIVLVGWSLGALVAWEYVDQFGTDGIRGLVNVDMEAAPGPAGNEEAPTYDLDRFRDINRSIQADHLAFIEQTIDVSFKHPPTDDLRTTILDEDSRSPPTVKSAIIIDATLCDYREVLPDIDVPMLVCAGADEKWRSVPVVKRTADLVPEARFELFEESGHSLTVEEPEKFNQVVSDFVKSL
ncbi:alpha/beta hydrolase [Halorussus limi]|uniref:Alpha/beta hydrolase n=1 Tax=Halorussus limi TaxID=2938695 RepID=A0A8U0HQJ4_9EURY|nr:alpha/beta hydrolase [Halorussus limi]UPV73210.1 alpha/beta hydrolase [Halorussus limi]